MKISGSVQNYVSIERSTGRVRKKYKSFSREVFTISMLMDSAHAQFSVQHHV